LQTGDRGLHAMHAPLEGVELLATMERLVASLCAAKPITGASSARKRCSAGPTNLPI
jgi:hypothetical protein